MKQLKIFINLTRLNRPIGYLLLFWPCSWGLAYAYSLNKDLENFLYYIVLFFLGAVLMRSAGCIVNDIVDRKLDKKVKRTKNRPLAANLITIKKAFIYVVILCGLAFCILIQFNFLTIALGLASMSLAFSYPFMKRITYWPQILLGIVFSWGVLIVSIQFNQSINIEFILLYIACVIWTLGYDTIYAYQDRDDDIKQNIKSTAVYFGKNGRPFVTFCYSLVILIFTYLGWNSSNSIFSLFIIAIIGISTYIAIQKWDINSEESSNFYFRQNNIFAFLLFVYLITF